MSTDLAVEASNLLALVGEHDLGSDLIEAAHELRAAAIEHDKTGARFEAAGAEVKRLLEGRMS